MSHCHIRRCRPNFSSAISTARGSFSFFFFSVLFQDNQKDLEMATEILSEYLERDITSECLSDIKQKVQDKYRHVL